MSTTTRRIAATLATTAALLAGIMSPATAAADLYTERQETRVDHRCGDLLPRWLDNLEDWRLYQRASLGDHSHRWFIARVTWFEEEHRGGSHDLSYCIDHTVTHGPR